MPEGQVSGISLNRGYKRIYNTSMPRQARNESCTGIFHVMMRGINHQNIFEDEEDNWQFINTLDRMRMRTDDNGLPCRTNCTYYGYCLMTRFGR